MKIIPNILTSINLLLGFGSIMVAASGELGMAGVLIMMAAVFDFSDGLAARGLNATSEIGKQLDTLADLVSFGVAPSFIAYVMIAAADEGLIAHEFNWKASVAGTGVLFTAVRLARFNAESSGSLEFKGMPSPAFGLIWAGLAYSTAEVELLNGDGWIDDIWMEISTNSEVLMTLIVLTSTVMILNFRMMSLKFSNFRLKGNAWRYTLLGLSVLVMVLGISGKTFGLSVVGCILLYVVLSLVRQLTSDRYEIQS